MLDIAYADLFKNFPPELATVLIAMIPIAELRVALPLALTTFNLPTFSAFFWSILGNMVPVVFILWLIEPVSAFLVKRSVIWRKFFDWITRRTQSKFQKNSYRYGVFVALMLFVAIPLPMTGAWTGALAAFLFRVPFSRALLAIFLGVCIASVAVWFITFSAITIL